MTDNKEAVLKELAESYQLITDALDEMQETASEAHEQLEEENMGNEDECWGAVDRDIFPPCIGLIKVGKGVLKKIKEMVGSKGDILSVTIIDELDNIAEECGQISPSVDELVMTFCPPVDHKAALENGNQLGEVLSSCLSKARQSHFVSENDTARLDFLCKALEHNMKNLKETISRTAPP